MTQSNVEADCMATRVQIRFFFALDLEFSELVDTLAEKYPLRYFVFSGCCFWGHEKGPWNTDI